MFTKISEQKQNIVIIGDEDLKNLIDEAICKALREQKLSLDSLPSTNFLSINDLSQKLKVSKATIHNWKRAGKLPFKRIGGRVFFLESDILAAIDVGLGQGGKRW